MDYKTVSIIIPVYNEEKTILELLDKINSVELLLNREIVIVNDGSKDSSGKLIQSWISSIKSEHKIVYLEKENGGKGSAVRYGIEHSTGDIVIIQDADLEYNPEEINICIKPIIENKYKIVYGSRGLYCKGREYSYLSFFIGGFVVTNWINFLFGSEMTDEPTCYKTYDGKLIRTLLFKGDGFEWEPEITCRLLRLGFKIHEVPIGYNPRNFEEGKKINAFDGAKALWISLVYRLISIKNDKIKLMSCQNEFKNFLAPKLKNFLLFLFFTALLLRILMILPGINNPVKNYSRPDTPTYVLPAKTLAHTGYYKYSLNDKKLYAYRAPGYPFYLALFFKFTNNLQWSIFFMCIISALTCIPIFYIGYYFGGKWTGFIAGLLFAFNITSIAHTPLILSDTLFTFILSIQLWYFMKFYFSKRPIFLFLAIFISSINCYVRPIEALWIFPCIFLILIYKDFYLKKKIFIILAAIFIFYFPVSIWMTRNYINDSGFKMSTDTGNVVYNHGAVLIGKIEHKSPEKIRQQMQQKNKLYFENHPEEFDTEASRTNYEENQLKKLIFNYPFNYFTLCLRPWTLIPDLPTFCQNIGITKSGKGTFDVLNTGGIFAAVKYYFHGNYYLIISSIPLLLIVFITYLGCIMQFIYWIFQKKYFLCFVALAFIEFFLFITSPTSMPRYHLPALPMMCVMAAITIRQVQKQLFQKVE